MTGHCSGISPPRQGPNLEVVAPAEWDALLARLGALDAHSCAAYQEASALLEPPGTEPAFLHFRDKEGELVLPLLLRPLPDAAGRDATSAYGYGGPAALGRPDLAAFGRALDAWARENAVVTTFLRLNPLLENGRLVPPSAELIDAGSTVVWDISSGRDLVAAMHYDPRKASRKADRAGVEMTVVERPRRLAEFQELYEETMRRQHADRFYFFPPAYWDALLADDAALRPVLVEARLDGRLVAAMLNLVSEPFLYTHLSGGDDRSRSIGASARCYRTSAEWGQAHGLTAFHLGGGLGGSTTSALYDYKRRFDPGSPPRPFQVAKLVHDQDRFRELAGTDSTAGFFPPWRQTQ